MTIGKRSKQMFFKRRKKRVFESPAACLLPQFAGTRERGRKPRRGGEYASDDSPGKLYTYVSAGNIELPDDDSEQEPVARRSIRPVVMLALLLVVIWVVF